MTSDDDTLPKLSQELDTFHISPTAEASPISSLFPEILCHIFILALPPLEGHSPLDNRLSPTRRLAQTKDGLWPLGPPWSLAQVCAHWRSVALGYGPLWSTIVVPQITPSHHSTCSLFYFKLILERSSSAPLDVLIRLNQCNKFVDIMIQTIVVHCARWRSLWIECDGQRLPPDEFGDSRLGTLPLLRHLTINGALGLRLEERFYSMFSDAPNLRSVALRSPGDLSHREIVLPWAQLTSYRAKDPSASAHFKRLLVTTQLVHCDLDFDDAQFPGIPADLRGVVTLQRLRRLVITNTEVLQHIIAPCLQELQVHGVVDHVPSFMHRSSCVLTRLTLFMCISPASQIVALLQLASSITVLELDYLGSADETAVLISALTIGAAEPICPGLASLSWGDRNDVVDRESLVDMVESRWRLDPPGQLRFVGVYLGCRRMKAAGWRLRCLANEGLEVVLRIQKKGRRVMERWRE
ncbi:hypothetical protein FB45DRAFT_1103125 [Roridomyces roridus]|uniref:F-box domain-containing protein n=1 Tax=Roridomyces roridus TaxID=1738132 RepID=A0AAD7BDW1_9AGAR|nr:hypothetical protein FB45DRAFT_1103125 [Roridomyces roridus]